MKVKLVEITKGEKEQERKIIKYVKSFDGCDLTLTDNEVVFKKNGKIIFESKLTEFEREPFFLTHIGVFQNNEKFRIVQSIGELKTLEELEGVNPSIIFASLNPTGYAMKFELI